jgi:uncharacterized protein
MPVRTLFLDTNGWFALLNEDDALHSHACDSWERLVRERCSIILTDWIVAETGNGLARTPQRRQFPEAVRQMRLSSRVRILPVAAALMEHALDLYESRSDKTWGLVDCASFVLMKEEGVKEAFTTDRHFEQAGFKCLLPATAA